MTRAPVSRTTLSFVVATRNRRHAISGCLDSIAAALALAAPIEAEIIVADNGSTDGTAAVVEAWASENRNPCRLVFEPKPGLSRARNRAVRDAKGDLLVFTDDDCRLDRDYVVELLAYDAADRGPVLRGGRVRLGDPLDLPLTVTAPSRRRWHQGENPVRHENMGAFILGCNMTLRRCLAERLGPFDEALGAGTALAAGEDHDYILRAYCAGAAVECVPDMAVAHFHGRRTPDEGRKLMRGYMTGAGAVYAKYVCKNPNLCRQAYWDCKSAAREILTGANLFMPKLDFSAGDKLRCYVRGATRYAFIRQPPSAR